MCEGINVTLESVLIEANTIEDNYSGGNQDPGMTPDNHGGGIAMHNVESATIVNNLFVRNHTDGNVDAMRGGGAIHALNCALLIVNNTFVENWCGTGDWPNITPTAYGGAVHIRWSFYGPTTILNNIFYDNRALTGKTVACTESGEATVSYCDASPGNQSSNYYATSSSVCNLADRVLYEAPDFAEGAFWLSTSSLLRLDANRGVSHAVNSVVPVLDINDCSRDGAAYTDMGAYESAHYPLQWRNQLAIGQ